MSEKIKVQIAPENVETLKEKYGVTEEALNAIIKNVEVSGPIKGEVFPKTLPLADEEPVGELGMLRQLSRGEVGMGEALMYMDVMDRKERRERRDEEFRSHPLSAEDIGKYVGANVFGVLKEAGLTGKPATTKEEMPDWAKEIQTQQDEMLKTKEEMPDWAKEIQTQQDEILKRMRSEEEDKKLKTAIKEATTPIAHQLEKAEEKIKELSSKPPTPPGQKSRLEIYLDTRKDLKEAGIIKEAESGTLMMVGPDGQPIQGIPVKGELPAALVYGPYVAEQIAGIIEKRIDKIATKYGLVETPGEGIPQPKGDLIKLPPKPTPKAPPPTPPPTEPPAEPPATAEIIKMPPKPTPPPEVAAEVEPEKKPELLCSRCDTPVSQIETKRGIRYRCPKCRKFTKIKEKAEKVECEEPEPSSQ